MEFLGFVFNSVKFTIAVTDHKFKNLKCLINEIHSHPKKLISIKFLAKVIGKIVSIFPTSDEAKLHYRTLERFKTKMVLLHNSWCKKIHLDDSCFDEISWWQTFWQTNKMVKSLEVKKSDEWIFLDASKIGHGSIWNGKEVQGLFTEKQKILPINTKELLAIYYALGAHAQNLVGKVVHFKCDNTTAIACIKNFRCRDVLRHKITTRIFNMAFAHGITLQISYVKSEDNISDRTSRKFDCLHGEWTLHADDFTTMMKLSQVTPQVDMFAHTHNNKLDRFYSWKPCINAEAIDALTVSWTDIKGYLFPPFGIISSVVKKCIDDEVKHMCCVFPLW